MSVVFGPSTWWVKSKEAADYYARICPVGTVLGDGSAVYRREGGAAWIVSPISTEVRQAWANGNYNTTTAASFGKNGCCICEWGGATGLCSCLIAKGFNPCDWFVPCQDILFIAYQCALQGCWGGTFAYSIASYHSSTEVNAICQCGVFFDCASQGFSYKCNTCWVRAFRCIIL